MPIRYVIKDMSDKTFYQHHPNRGAGWYGSLEDARMYIKADSAQKVIATGGHHVAHPGGRELRVVRVNITEEPELD